MNNRPKCLGTKEYASHSSICLSCRYYQQCKKKINIKKEKKNAKRTNPK